MTQTHLKIENDPMMRDLGQHLDRRVSVAVRDMLDTCDRVDMPRERRVGLILSVLAHVMTTVAFHSGGAEDDVHEVLRVYWRTMRERDPAEQ